MNRINCFVCEFVVKQSINCIQKFCVWPRMNIREFIIATPLYHSSNQMNE